MSLFSGHPKPDPVGPGQESVWAYPRPPRVEPSTDSVEVWVGGVRIALATRSWRVLETSHPPTYYLPREAFAEGALRPAEGSSYCEWKGMAEYWDVVMGDVVLPRVGWSYPDPSPAFAALRDHIAFYAGPFDRCSVDGEKVIPQPGGFYGGWITSKVSGPFKGVPGSRFW